MPHRSCSPRTARGITLPEVLVAGLAAVVALGAAASMMQRDRDSAFVTMSFASLKNLASANEKYAVNRDNRRFKAVPDATGKANGNCETYISQISCPPQQRLGFDVTGSM